MDKLCINVMTVSLTVNFCVLCFNVVPRLRTFILNAPRLRRWKTILKICQHYSDRPLILSKIFTEQLLIWTLVLLSATAICSTDVILLPFHDSSNGWKTIFIEVLFGVNVGRYLFTIVQKIFFKRYLKKVQYRADLTHHFATLICYILFLAYGQNMLLGLVGMVVESTSIFDEIGRYFNDRDRRHTVHYRRLVVVGCVCTICFRGVVPITFLVIAMFQQTPFVMDYLPLTVFFFSIIFFSVINVWQILTNIQRLVKHTYEKANAFYQSDCPERGCVHPGQPGVHQPRTRKLQLSKNNLGYLRPYPNRNIANHLEDEKHNLNNRKEFTKDTSELVDPSIRFSSVSNKLKEIANEPDVTSEPRRHSDVTPGDQSYSNMRDSNGSTYSSSSGSVLLASPSRLNNLLIVNTLLTPGSEESTLHTQSLNDVTEECHYVQPGSEIAV